MLESTDQSPNEISSTEIPHRPVAISVAGKTFPEFHPNSARPLCPRIGRIFTWPSVIATWKSKVRSVAAGGKKRGIDGRRNGRLIVGDWRVGGRDREKGIQGGGRRTVA